MKDIDKLNYRPFTRFCMSIGAVPTSYLAGLTIEEQLLWLCSYLEKEVIPAVNNNGEAVEELQDLYVELKNYVDNYFENLDVQEEINNKLDAMVLDGTFDRIINQEIFGELNTKVNSLLPLLHNSKAKVHCIDLGTNNGESTAIEIENNNILIDLGTPDSYNTLVAYLIAHQITTFKYLIISHWDIDHSNSVENFEALLENTYFDFSECQFIFPHKHIDWTRTTGNEGQEERESSIRAYLLANNYTIIEPEEEDTITIDDNNYLKFYNLKASYFEDYYVLTDDAGNPQEYTNYNAFSMVTELNSCGKSIFFTGDIDYLSEDNIVDEIKKIDVWKLPHHGLNRYSNQVLCNKFYGKVGIITSQAADNTATLRPGYQTFVKGGKLLSTSKNGDIVLDIADDEIYYLYEKGTEFQPNVHTFQENTDLNDILNEGTYLYNNTTGVTLTHMPALYNNQCLLKVLQITSLITYQFMFTFNANPIIWIRKYTSGSGWTEWNQINQRVYSYMIANNNTTLELASTSFEKLPLDHVIDQSNQGNLTLENGTITIGDGISVVRVTANVLLSYTQAGDRVAFALYKNNNAYQRNDTYAYADANQVFTVETLMHVTKGDKVGLYVRNITAARGKVASVSYSTNMQIEVVQ